MRFLELFFLNGFAIAQPTFAVLALHPEFLSAHGVGQTELALLVVALCGALPTAGVIASRGLAQVSRGLGALFGTVVLGLLTALAVFPPIADITGSRGTGVVLAAIGLGGAMGWLLHHRPSLRRALGAVAPLALVFPASFWFSESVQSAMGPAAPGSDRRRGPAAEFRGPPVESDTTAILLVLDELPVQSLMTVDREIDAERFPNFYALAGEAHWFRNATTVGNGTEHAVASILTGKRVDHRRQSTSFNEPHTLFRLLENGDGILAYEYATSLCPPGLSQTGESNPGLRSRMRALMRDVSVLYAHRIAPAGWRESLPPVDMRWKNFVSRDAQVASIPESEPATGASAAAVHAAEWDTLAGRTGAGLERLERALRALHGGKRPTFLFLHLLLPHDPWTYYPSGRAYTRATTAHGLTGSILSGNEWQATQAQQRHLLQLGYADRLLGLLIAELREVGLYDDTLLVVVADHGRSFEPGTYTRGLGDRNFAEVMGVPLFVKLPHQRVGSVSDRNVETVDILPTIAAVLDVEVPWETEGTSLFSQARERAEKSARNSSRRGDDRPPWAVSREQFEEATERVLRRNRRRLGSGAAALFASTPAAEQQVLLGRRVEALEIEATRGRVVELADLDALARVSSRGPLPGHLTGRVRSEQGAIEPIEPIDLAIAVNGTVEAVTRTYRVDEDEQHWTAMLPEAVLRTGANRVEVFEVIAAAGTFRLRATNLVPRS